MKPSPSPEQNRLLAGFPAHVVAAWQGQLEPVVLRPGEVLHHAGTRATHVYFPTTAIVSLRSVLDNGAFTQLAVIGNEGFVGIALLTGGESLSTSAVVQNAGHAYRLTGSAIREAFEHNASVTPLLLRYIQALITQMAQTAVCSRLHSIEQQFCRWLLLSVDRAQQDELVMTHEGIANMLGVRREQVTQVTRRLQTTGTIAQKRGRIVMLDRRALESHACECYGVLKREYARLLAPGTTR